MGCSQDVPSKQQDKMGVDLPMLHVFGVDRKVLVFIQIVGAFGVDPCFWSRSIGLV